MNCERETLEVEPRLNCDDVIINLILFRISNKLLTIQHWFKTKHDIFCNSI